MVYLLGDGRTANERALFACDDIYSEGNWCKRSLRLRIIGDETQKKTDHAVMLEISLKISGLKQSQIMQLSVKISEIQAQILIGSKSIHYLMNVAIIAQLQIPIQAAVCLSLWQMENLSPELVSEMGYKLC